MTLTAHLNQLVSPKFSLESESTSVSLWVPTTQLNCFQLAPMVAPKKKWPDIIAWQLEEFLLDSPDTYQIVWHQDNVKQPLNVLAVQKKELNQWVSITKEKNINPVVMVPDFFALSVTPSGWTAYVDNDQAIVRTDQAQGFACEHAFFWQLLERELQVDESLNVCLWLALEQVLPEDIQSNTRISIEYRKVNWQKIDPPKYYDLLSRTPKPQQALGLSLWKTPSLLLVCLIMLTCLWAWLAGNHYQKSSAKLAQIVQRDYQQLFGEKIDSPEFAMNEGFNKQQLNQAQVRLFKQGNFAKLRDLDFVLSSCNECELNSLLLKDGEFELSIIGPKKLRNRFVSLANGYHLNWQGSDSNSHQLTLKSMQARTPSERQQ